MNCISKTPCLWGFHRSARNDQAQELPSGKHVRVMYTPLYPTFIAKLGYSGVHLFFLFLLQNIDCGYSLEPPRRGGSNIVPTINVLSKNIKTFLINFSIFTDEKNLCILHGQVFVMIWALYFR